MTESTYLVLAASAYVFDHVDLLGTEVAQASEMVVVFVGARLSDIIHGDRDLVFA